MRAAVRAIARLNRLSWWCLRKELLRRPVAGFAVLGALLVPPEDFWAPTPESPANGSTIADFTPTFSWSSLSWTNSYFLQVTSPADVDFASPFIYVFVNDNGYTADSISDGTYRWRVRGTHNVVLDTLGEWSSVSNFTLDTVPRLLTPADASMGTDHNPSFSWTSVEFATGYRLEVTLSTDVGFSSPLIQHETSAAHTIAGTLSDGSYRWRVRVIYPRIRPWSSVFMFTIATPLTFQTLGTHPYASLQTSDGLHDAQTAQGKILHALHAWDGKIYSGYGDYGANTGPIAIAPYNPATQTFQLEKDQQTETIDVFRDIGGKLYSPAIDPSAEYGDLYDFAIGKPWLEKDLGFAWHIFDVATRTGSDLYASGSTNGCPSGTSCGAVWESNDGGSSWTISFRDTAQGTNRCYRMMAFQQRIYVKCSTGSYMYDGSSWSTSSIGPIGTDAYGTANGNIVYQGKLILQHYPSIGKLSAYDGSSHQVIRENLVTGRLASDGGYLFLWTGNTVYKTNGINPPSWVTVGTVPPNASSFTLLNGYLYIGTTDSMLLRSSQPVY